MDGEKLLGCGTLLPAVLRNTHIGMVYYSADGEPVLCLGDDVPGEYMQMTEQRLSELRQTDKPQRELSSDERGSYIVTYSNIKGSSGAIQGYVMTRQFAGRMSDGADDKAIGSKHTTVTADTNLSDLFADHPGFRDDIGRLDNGLSGVKDPMLLEMLNQATVGELAKSLGTGTDDLIEKINELIKSYSDGE